eukprot:gene12042-13285_t
MKSGMLTRRQDVRDSDEQSPFSSFRQRWMSGHESSGLSKPTEKGRLWGDFSREADRRALTASFFRGKDTCSLVSKSAGKDFFRRHNTQRSKTADTSLFKKSLFSNESGNRIDGSTGFSSRFGSSRRFERTVTTEKATVGDVKSTEKTEVSETNIQTDSARTVQTTKRDEATMLRQVATQSSKNANARFGNVNQRASTRRKFQRTEIMKQDEFENTHKADSSVISKKIHNRSVETVTIASSTSDNNSENGPDRKIEETEASTDGPTTNVLQSRKVPPKVLKKPVVKTPVEKRNNEEKVVSENTVSRSEKITISEEKEAVSHNKQEKTSDCSESPSDSSNAKLSVSSLRNSLFGGDSSAFAAIAARGMGGTLAASAVTLRTRRAVERRQVVSSTEVLQNGTVSRSTYRMERKSESEVEVCRNEAMLLPTLFSQFEKPKRKHITLPSKEFRRSQLQLTSGNEAANDS